MRNKASLYLPYLCQTALGKQTNQKQTDPDKRKRNIGETLEQGSTQRLSPNMRLPGAILINQMMLISFPMSPHKAKASDGPTTR